MKIKLPSWLSLYSQVIVATEYVLYLHAYISQVSSTIEPIRKRHCVEGYFSTGKSHHPCLLSYLPFIYGGLSQALHVTCSENGTIINDCRPTLTKCLTGGVWEKSNMIYNLYEWIYRFFFGKGFYLLQGCHIDQHFIILSRCWIQCEIKDRNRKSTSSKKNP